MRVLYVDSPEEADPGALQTDLCQDHGCVVLVRNDLGEEVVRSLGELPGKIVARQFDPEAERLVDVLREIKNANWDSSAPPLRISLIAPLQFLKKEGIRPEELGKDAGFEGLRIFASSCTAENVPIRDCRTMLARFFSFLVKFTDELLEQCPFLACEDGVYAPTVAFIPEKYRIDARRAEEILDRGLLKWLNIITGQSEEPEHQIVQPTMKI